MIPAIIVPVLTRHDLLDRMIVSIDFPTDKLLVIDNASNSDWEPIWNPWIKKIHHVKSPTNLGVASSWNLGIKMLPFCEWWLIANFDLVFENKALDEFNYLSNSNEIVLSNAQPEWACFSIGWQVVDKVGLFDEALHPAYFEDNDYERRARLLGVSIKESYINIAHDNSSTIQAGFQNANAHTFVDNHNYYQNKKSANDFTQGSWSITRRRKNSWD